MSSSFEAVYAIVRAIPRGRVMTYGQVSERHGGLSAVAIGWALAQCPDDVPWQRVVNAAGRCSVDGRDGEGRQRKRLEAEGVVFDGDRLDLKRYRFR